MFQLRLRYLVFQFLRNNEIRLHYFLYYDNLNNRRIKEGSLLDLARQELGWLVVWLTAEIFEVSLFRRSAAEFEFDDGAIFGCSWLETVLRSGISPGVFTSGHLAGYMRRGRSERR